MKFLQPYTLEKIAKIVDAEFIGNPGFKVLGINEIHMVEQGDLTFVDHPKYYDMCLNSKATTIIINKKLSPPEGKTLIICDDPFDAYMKLVAFFKNFQPSNSLISESATIGEGTIIQPGSFIGNNVKIGKNCQIHSNVSIYDDAIIGDDVVIHSSSVIGADAYYFQKKNDEYRKFLSCGRVIIEDNVEIGALCAIDRGVSGDTIIGKGTKIDNHSQVGHDTKIGQHCLIGAFAAIGGVTKIEDDVILWARVVVNKNIVIGKKAVILATSGVDKNIKGGITYFGSPVLEARKKWKEMVMLKNLPELYKKVEDLQKKSN